MLEYCKRNPEVEYVYQSSGTELSYVSTRRGSLGEFKKRESYLQLLSSCRVSLVSSLGKDASKDFGGIDFITPRFYESAVNYCHMIGRYTDNEEAERIGIKEVCPCVDTFGQFAEFMNRYLREDKFLEKAAFDNFCGRHVTSARVQEILQIIKDKS